MHYIEKSIIAAAVVSTLVMLPQFLENPLPVTPAELGFCERMFGLGHTACFLYHKTKFLFEHTFYGAMALSAGYLALGGGDRQEPQPLPQQQQSAANEPPKLAHR